MPTSLDRVTGMRLRELREMRGYTQRELAFALDVAPSLIRHWEKGHKLIAARIDQAAKALEVRQRRCWSRRARRSGWALGLCLRVVA